jgi:hypothetical protein
MLDEVVYLGYYTKEVIRLISPPETGLLAKELHPYPDIIPIHHYSLLKMIPRIISLSLLLLTESPSFVRRHNPYLASLLCLPYPPLLRKPYTQ